MHVTIPTYISRFYDNQAHLRGITTVEHVVIQEAIESQVYDRMIYKYLAPYKERKVVEIACGPGIFMRYLKNQNFENAIGIEMAEPYIKICLEQGLNVAQADALEWLKSQPKSSIDVIIAIDFIEHLDKEIFIQFLDSVSSALSENGLFIARGPCGDSPFFGLNFYNDITHETVFTTVALKVLMLMCDLEMFETVEECPVNTLPTEKWLQILLSKVSRFIIKKLIYWSTGHHIDNLSPNIWLICKPIT